MRRKCAMCQKVKSTYSLNPLSIADDKSGLLGYIHKKLMERWKPYLILIEDDFHVCMDCINEIEKKDKLRMELYK